MQHGSMINACTITKKHFERFPSLSFEMEKTGTVYLTDKIDCINTCKFTYHIVSMLASE